MVLKSRAVPAHARDPFISREATTCYQTPLTLLTPQHAPWDQYAYRMARKTCRIITNSPASCMPVCLHTWAHHHPQRLTKPRCATYYYSAKGLPSAWTLALAVWSNISAAMHIAVHPLSTLGCVLCCARHRCTQQQASSLRPQALRTTPLQAPSKASRSNTSRCSQLT